MIPSHVVSLNNIYIIQRDNMGRNQYRSREKMIIQGVHANKLVQKADGLIRQVYHNKKWSIMLL